MALLVFPALSKSRSSARCLPSLAGSRDRRPTRHFLCIQVPYVTDADHAGSRPGRYKEIAVDHCSGSIDVSVLFDLILASMIGHLLPPTCSCLPHIPLQPNFSELVKRASSRARRPLMVARSLRSPSNETQNREYNMRQKHKIHAVWHAENTCGSHDVGRPSTATMR